MTDPVRLYCDEDAKKERRQVIAFASDEVLVEHGIVQRIEFTNRRCNLTLKNSTEKRQRVRLSVHVLNSDLVEIWRQKDRWRISSLKPDQSHSLSWEFEPQMPEVIWDEKMRENTAPTWVLIYVR